LIAVDRRLDVAVAADHPTGKVGSSRRMTLRMSMPSMSLPCSHMSRTTSVGCRARDGREGLHAVARLARLVALILEDAADEHADIGLIVDDEDVMRHDHASTGQRRVAHR